MGNDYNISQIKPTKKKTDLNSYLNNNSELQKENELLFNFNANKKTYDDEVMGFQHSAKQKLIESDDLINKKIENNKQGKLGDCWLLAQINGLADTEFGAKIIRDAITINPDKSYTVKLKGAGEEYTISQKELKKARKSRKYSKGDADVQLLELAFEKYYQNQRADFLTENKDLFTDKEINEIQKQRSIDGGNYYSMSTRETEFSKDITFLLGGNEYASYTFNEEEPDNISYILKQKAAFPDDIALTFGTNIDINTGKAYNQGGHQLSVRNVYLDNNGNISQVDIINPHDNSKVITKTFDEFMSLNQWVQVSASKEKMIELTRYKITTEAKHFKEDSLSYKLYISRELNNNENIDYKKLFIKANGGIQSIINTYRNLLIKEDAPQLTNSIMNFLVELFPQGDKTLKSDLPQFTNEYNISAYRKEKALEEEQFSPTPADEFGEEPPKDSDLNVIFPKAFGCDVNELLNNPEKLAELCRQYGYM